MKRFLEWCKNTTRFLNRSSKPGKMKVGLVESLNARPLTWGFEKNPLIETVYESPKVLSEMLLRGELDTALISSVECLRNQDKLSYSLSCGVCTKTSVRSILFFHHKMDKVDLSKVLVESGSRTSVALLDLLLWKQFKRRINLIPEAPSIIKDQLKQSQGSHLLFGDNALLAEYDSSIYEVFDLAEWWNRITGLYFIFALWAYPKDKWIQDSFFLESLEFGMENIQDIIDQEKRFPSKFTYNYLMKELYYKPEAKSFQGFLQFEIELKKMGIL
jgi:chorismate dehydratase